MPVTVRPEMDSNSETTSKMYPSACSRSVRTSSIVGCFFFLGIFPLFTFQRLASPAITVVSVRSTAADDKFRHRQEPSAARADLLRPVRGCYRAVAALFGRFYGLFDLSDKTLSLIEKVDVTAFIIAIAVVWSHGGAVAADFYVSHRQYGQ